MDEWIDLIFKAYKGYSVYLGKAMTNPLYNGLSPFYGLLALSLIVWGLEIAWPWRKKQGLFRKDFLA